MTPATATFYRLIGGTAARFAALLEQGRSVQFRQLQSILARNAACEYGRRFGFGAIRTYEDYRARVPVVDYETLRPDIERMAAGAAGVLVSAPLAAFEETGGSTGGSRLIPYTAASLDAFRRALLPWLDDLASAYPAIARGRAYWAISPAARLPRTTQGGVPVGLGGDAAYFGAELAPHVGDMLAVPAGIATSRDVGAWREVTCKHLLGCTDLALVSVWSPTFFSDLLRHMVAHAESLAACLPASGRAHLIRTALRAQPPDFAAIWPQLRIVSCWDQASSRAYAQELRALLPAAALQGKGLLATEGVATIPLAAHAMPVLALESGFFELQDANGECCAACDASAGEDYSLVMTTAAGLYRYAIGDRVRVHGRLGETPMLEFLGRGNLASDLCGEKLTEAFVVAATSALGLRFALLAPLDDKRPGYALFVDAAEVAAAEASALARRVDEALDANPQYAYARRLGQLAPVAIRRCVDPLGTWQTAALARGMRLADIKPSALSPEAGWERRFDSVSG